LRRRSPRGCLECGYTTYFITDCPKWKKLDSSNKYNYIKQKDYSKFDDKKKHCFGDMKKKFQKIMPERVLPSVTSTSLVTTPPSQRRMRRSSASKVTSPAFPSLANFQDTSPTLTLM
jgi:hypothetical protein